MDKFNFQYIIGTDYDYKTTPCCCPPDHDDYCRCTQIYDAEVTSIDIMEISKHIVKKLGLDGDDLYFINRILSINKLYDLNSWEVEVCGGYYGEEVEGVYPVRQIEEKVKREIEDFLKCKTMIEKVFFVLDLEYGFILPSIESKTETDIVYVDRELVIPAQEEHYVKLDKTAIEAYRDYDLPRCICRETSGYYKIVDGYHRYAASAGQSQIEIIVLKD